jgi:hypothetical protein
MLKTSDQIDWAEISAEARERFGITEFRPGQRELIEYVLAGRNALGILPTGAGKSLCYQLPALFLERAVVVVSPLVALMQDQEEHMAIADIASVRLDSSISAGDQKTSEDALRKGDHSVVLMTPERLSLPSGWIGDSHPQVVEHARHTNRRPHLCDPLCSVGSFRGPKNRIYGPKVTSSTGVQKQLRGSLLCRLVPTTAAISAISGALETIW